MKRIVFMFVGVIVVSLLFGCATAYMRTDLSGSKPKGLYPATRADVVGAYRYCANKSDPFGGWRGAGTPSNPNIIEKFLWVTFSTVDLPFSLVSDTLCLPSDLPKKKELKDAPTTDSTLSSEGAPLDVQMKSESKRVCRAWHVAWEVKVLSPGIGEAEGKRKGNCVTARWGGEDIYFDGMGLPVLHVNE